MMFAINTATEVTIADLVPGWFRDQMPADATPERIAHQFAYHMIGAMKNPKKIETVGQHIIAQWEFLRRLHQQDPALWAEVLRAFGERYDEIA